MQDRIKKVDFIVPNINSKVIRLAFLFLFVFIGMDGLSQISDQSIPESFRFATKSAKIINEIVLDSVHVIDRIEQDKLLGIPNRYGVVQSMNVDIREKGTKSETSDFVILQYEINCPDAVSLGVFFRRFILPPGASVYLYKPDRTQIRGGFTAFNNKDDNQLAIGEFQGNRLLIEYDEPKNAEFPGELIIGSVSTAYAEFSSEATGRVQINCPEGAGWQDEKHAVCRMTFRDNQYSYYCSGALINNVRNDGTPYFLTANHCISTTNAASTLVTYFNYENSSCASTDARLKQSLSGAKFIAGSTYTDFTLLRLSEYPPAEYYPLFAGWNASSDQPQTGTCIHHPGGSTKCIAIDHDPPQSYNNVVQWSNGSTTSRNTHWEVQYEVGTDENGSSGSPLFDSEKRIIGQLHGGDDAGSLFGKFSLSWNYYSTASSHLKTWLDPDNTGTLRLDGLGYRNAPVAGFVADVSIACLSTSVLLTDKSKSSPTKWDWKIVPETYEFVNGTSGNSQNPEVRFTADGYYSVTLTASNEFGFDDDTQNNLIYAATKLPVEFVGMPAEITMCGYDLKNFELVAAGANAYSFNVSKNEYFDTEINSNVLIVDLKDGARQYGDFDTYVKVTGSHGTCSVSDSVLIHVQMPINDDMENAIALQLGRNINFNNRCGTVQANEPTPPTSGCEVKDNWCPPLAGTPVLDNSVWFSFKGTSNRTMSIQTEGIDSQIAVYESDIESGLLPSFSQLYQLAAGDNFTSKSSVMIPNLRVVPGKTYWLQVDGKNGASGELTVSLLSNTIEVFPNPSSGIFHFTISSLTDGLAELSVFSFTGQQVLSQTKPITDVSNTFDMDLSGLPAGFYLLRANINGLVMTKKLILTNSY